MPNSICKNPKSMCSWVFCPIHRQSLLQWPITELHWSLNLYFLVDIIVLLLLFYILPKYWILAINKEDIVCAQMLTGGNAASSKQAHQDVLKLASAQKSCYPLSWKTSGSLFVGLHALLFTLPMPWSWMRRLSFLLGCTCWSTTFSRVNLSTHIRGTIAFVPCRPQ